MIKPKYTPKQSLADTIKILEANGIKEPICLVGIRGYYKNSMGDGKNSRNLYDDAIFVIGPECYIAFNANTDPSALYKKNVASLCPGVYEYIKGQHGISGNRPYPALRQYSDVFVKRDGYNEVFKDSPNSRFWINIHRGGRNSTSSEGCQTIHPDQWDSFISTVYRIMKENFTDKIKYILREA